jgi:hypothetical protein
VNVRALQAAASAAALLLAGVSGCSRPGDVDCAAFSGPPTATTETLLLLVDVERNDPGTADRIGAAVEPHLGIALDRRMAVRVVLDPGAGLPLSAVACLDGTAALSVQRANDRREQADLVETRRDIADLVRAAVRASPVAPTGTATRLLREATRAAPERSRVVLWSSLLGTRSGPDDGDCLALDGLAATPEVAEGLVSRCRASRQVEDVPAALVLLGAGWSATATEQSLLSSWLAAELCRQVSTRCTRGE